MDEKLVTIHGTEPLKSRWANTSPSKPEEPKASTKSPAKSPTKTLVHSRSTKHNNDETTTPRRTPKRGGQGKPKQAHSAPPKTRHQQRNLPDLFPSSSLSKPSFPISPLQDRRQPTKSSVPLKDQPKKEYVLLDLNKPFSWDDDEDDF